MLFRNYSAVVWIAISCLVTATVACQPEKAGTPTTVGDEALVDAVVQALLAEERPRDGAIIAFFSQSDTPTRLWKVQGGSASGANAADYAAALGADTREWKPVVSIEILEQGAGTARVEVRTLYDCGMLPTSRGGNSAEWTLARRDNDWRVTARKSIIFWD